MKFKQLIMPLMVLGIFLAMSNSAFAVITCGLSAPLGSTPRATATGHTEPIAAGPPAGVTPNPPTDGGGTLRVTCSSTANENPGVVVFTINLNAQITNTTTHPSAAAGIRLANVTNDLVGNVGISAVQNSAGNIIIGIGNTPFANLGSPTVGAAFTAGTTSTFDILGVLVSAQGRTAPIVATLVSTGGITVGSPAAGSGPTVSVIDSILPGLLDPTVPTSVPGLVEFAAVTGGPAVLNSAGQVVGGKGNFVIRIQEGYQDVFREASQFNGPGLSSVFPQSPSSDVQVQVILSNIPAGLNISNCTTTMTNLAGSATSGGTPSINFTNVTAASPILTVNFNSAVDLDNVDVLWIICGTVGVGTASTPLPSQSVTAQVRLAPTGLALSTGPGNPPLTGLTTGQVPRYQDLLQPATPITVVLFPPSNTVLLVPFAFVGPGYNTGIAVANTTVDPFGPASGGAATSSGTVSFLLVKNDGTTRTYVTSASSPGSGLTGAGVVASGSTYVVNLSELLSAANFGTSFTGYVFITANFTHAHGSATIYTTANGNQALSSPMLVLPAVSSAALRGSPESLGQ